MLANINFYKNLLGVHNKAGNYEFNRSIKSRFHTARISHERRADKVGREDNFTVNELAYLAFERDITCPVCGFGFNTSTRRNETGYSWEVSHIVEPREGGKFTMDNLFLSHTDCNKSQGRRAIDFRKFNDEHNFNCYLDFVGALLQNNLITGKEPEYRNFVKLLKRIQDGFDPNNSGRRG